MIESFLIFFVALFFLVEGSDYLVENVAKLASLFKVSDFLIGLTVIAIGTSLPELAASIAAVFQSDTGLVVGNIVGSNIANIGLILGVAALFSVLSVDEELFRREGLFLLVLSLLFFILALDLRISFFEGMLFLLLSSFYFVPLLGAGAVARERYSLPVSAFRQDCDSENDTTVPKRFELQDLP